MSLEMSASMTPSIAKAQPDTDTKEHLQEPGHLGKFPPEVMSMIVAELDPHDLLSLQLSCKALGQYVKTNLPTAMIAHFQQLHTDHATERGTEVSMGLAMSDARRATFHAIANYEIQHQHQNPPIMQCSYCERSLHRTDFDDTQVARFAVSVTKSPSLSGRQQIYCDRHCISCGLKEKFYWGSLHTFEIMHGGQRCFVCHVCHYAFPMVDPSDYSKRPAGYVGHRKSPAPSLTEVFLALSKISLEYTRPLC